MYPPFFLQTTSATTSTKTPRNYPINKKLIFV
jgi:hypothetical protein